jgi:hypothetical protein
LSHHHLSSERRRREHATGIEIRHALRTNTQEIKEA